MSKKNQSVLLRNHCYYPCDIGGAISVGRQGFESYFPFLNEELFGTPEILNIKG